MVSVLGIVNANFFQQADLCGPKMRPHTVASENLGLALINWVT